ncbi:50S ribosomal protein L15 [Polystyrenella longa]|uniref:Large ribosomal subunit protein uL15 n=1 Tax=Polystyrenella longa TaxID=2528007 RepID=A0A518CR70_9PLAN|nr:50S ribosomal protein L15 [Polystyrenella longa]QDU81732.1 50S ribosomal protein L15 [Polystyrenella longa]
MIIDDVHRGIKKNKTRKRIGRGPGSGHGKTSGRGHNGYYSRSGSSRRTGFEGGQTPLFQRIAKRGFNNKRFATTVGVVNLSRLEDCFNDGDEVTPDILKAKNLINNKFEEVKILGTGELTKKLSVKAHRFSKTALEQITAKGGTAEVIESLDS